MTKLGHKAVKVTCLRQIQSCVPQVGSAHLTFRSWPRPFASRNGWHHSHGHAAPDTLLALPPHLQSWMPQAWHQLTARGSAPGPELERFCLPQSRCRGAGRMYPKVLRKCGLMESPGPSIPWDSLEESLRPSNQR